MLISAKYAQAWRRSALRLSQAGTVRLRENPRMRGTWFSAAIGQTLRHKPGASIQRSGSTGNTNNHQAINPARGATNSTTTNPSALTTVATESDRQTQTGTGWRIWT